MNDLVVRDDKCTVVAIVMDMARIREELVFELVD